LDVSEPTVLELTVTPNTLTIPASGTFTAEASVQVWDQAGELIPGPDAAYALDDTYPGVTIDSVTGVITVDSAAEAGTVTVQAAIDDLTATAELTLTVASIPSGGTEYEIEAAEGGVYTVSLRAENFTSFAGRTFTVTYDPEVLALLDFAAQTGGLSVSPGPVAGTPLTLVAHDAGVLTFTADKTVPGGKAWGGVLTVLRFAGLDEGETEICVA
jgi:hypothetical protein